MLWNAPPPRSEGSLAPIAILVVVWVAMFGAILAGAVVVLRDTIRRRGWWGLNFRPVVCPRCETPTPAVRVPKNRRQTLWGGHTCEMCGCEYDKWGHEVQPAPTERGGDR